ncbi:MAG: transporter substrate-binding domain-containing protein [Desulfobacteraceae bacterium]|uniref:Transporter substrate-binding domain-containing protein n=1 Tax=Candidatus Desulfacyla euxinica TaxID=2841693 RepID=A0A8J6MZ59_9DELT|nr:transporter substrate-binding domain-containing protein [Candidatus Desulfacyla euxinica]MBL6977858.1 transporter substrate-binding domain-containing protein [Desulfobacteraceae bacterium]
MLSPRYLMILAVFILMPAEAFPDTILLKADTWCPYNCALDARQPGYTIEIAKRIFEKTGHKFKYEIAPWSRALKLVKEDDITAVVGVTRNEAPALIFPEQEFGISDIHFFKRKGFDWVFAGIGSLKTVRVGIMGDYEYGKELDEYFKKYRNTKKVQSIKSKEPLVLNIRKLLKDRIDVIPEDKAVFIYTASSMGVWDKIQDAGVDPINSKEALEESKLYIAFSPTNPKSKQYARLITDGIEQMRLSGELKEILAKYKLTDWREDYKDVIEKYEK